MKKKEGSGQAMKTFKWQTVTCRYLNIVEIHEGGWRPSQTVFQRKRPTIVWKMYLRSSRLEAGMLCNSLGVK